MFLNLIKTNLPAKAAGWPFSIPTLRSLEQIEFNHPVTLLVGENGTGKSTLLEAIAVLSDAVAIGSSDLRYDNSLSGSRELARYLKATWRTRSFNGFFLRAEDFLGYCRRLHEMRAELEHDLKGIELSYREQKRSEYATMLATGTMKGQLAALDKRYGDGLDHRSHGESFLHFFGQSLAPGGLYLLDEPETPLSPQNQIAFIALIAEAVQQGSQFIIATHSPILLSYPGAQIISLDHLPPRQVDYQELDHVTLTRNFLNNPEAFLRHLVKPDNS